MVNRLNRGESWLRKRGKRRRPEITECIPKCEIHFQADEFNGSHLKTFSRIHSVFLTIPALLFAVGAASAQSSGVPDAPEPHAVVAAAVDFESGDAAVSTSLIDGEAAGAWQNQSPPAQADPQAASSMKHAAYERRKWAQYVDPGERIPALYPHDKWVFWLHEEARVSTVFPALVSAGYGQLTDTPSYGSDSEAFGDRVGAAFLRQATMRFFCSSFYPVVYREDPRYFRNAEGGYGGRAGWAAERAFITQKDSGSHGFNFSNIIGHLTASVLTAAYYPQKSVNAHVVLQTWGTSIAGSAGNNLFLEFWPDVVNAIHKHKQDKDSSGTR